MKVPRSIDNTRRKLMHGLTKNLGRSRYPKNRSFEPEKIKSVLIIRPNHRLGNQLLISPLVQEINATFPGSKIDLFVKGNLAPILFENYDNIDKIIRLPKKPFSHLIDYLYGWARLKSKRYDLVINVDKNSSSGKISTQLSRADYKFFESEKDEVEQRGETYQKAFKHLAKYPVLSFRNHLSKLGMVSNEKPVPLIDLKLSPSEISKGAKTLENLVDPEKNTIGLFTYATRNKCYSKAWWEAFHEQLKSKYKNYNFLEILPAENVSQIAFQEPTFYSLDIREIGGLIAKLELFIGADSGMMHLASATKTPTLGLFSVTDTEKYGPYGNNSKALNTNQMDLEGIFREIDIVLKTKLKASEKNHL